MSVKVNITAPSIGLASLSDFSAEVTVASLRPRFYAMTGFELSSIKIVINGAKVDDETVTLGSFGTNPVNIELSGKSEFGDLNDVSEVKKYEISDAQYDALPGTIREMKRKAGIPVKGEALQKKEEEAPEGIEVGNRCEVEMADHSHHRGEVKFVGTTHCAKGYWVGVALDEPYGKNNGTLKGKAYFECGDNYGVFVKPAKVKVGDFPPIDWEKELEDEDEM